MHVPSTPVQAKSDDRTSVFQWQRSGMESLTMAIKDGKGNA
jgi:hypothetical protein